MLFLFECRGSWLVGLEVSVHGTAVVRLVVSSSSVLSQYVSSYYIEEVQVSLENATVSIPNRLVYGAAHVHHVSHR